MALPCVEFVPAPAMLRLIPSKTYTSTRRTRKSMRKLSNLEKLSFDYEEMVPLLLCHCGELTKAQWVPIPSVRSVACLRNSLHHYFWIGSYEIWCPSETFSSVFSYLCLNRGNLRLALRCLSLLP